MDKEIIKFGDIEIEKHKFHCYENLIFLEDVDINNVLISNKISSGEKSYKYFIGYLDDDYKIKSLHIMLLKGHMQKVMMVKLSGHIFRLKMMTY